MPSEISMILDFMIRQPIPDSIINRLFRSIAIADEPDPTPDFRKSLLIRCLQSDISNRTITERTLSSLELIEELDRSNGKAPSISMRSAYVDVAVECTVIHLRASNPEGLVAFFDAVNRIWNCRIGDLERSEASGLVSGKLRMWRRELELAVGNVTVRGKIVKMNTEAETLLSVEEYVKESWRELGPSLLEIKAHEYLHRCAGHKIMENGKGFKLDNRVGMAGDSGLHDVARELGVDGSVRRGEKRVLDEFEQVEASIMELGSSHSGLDRERARQALENGLEAADANATDGDVGGRTSQGAGAEVVVQAHTSIDKRNDLQCDLAASQIPFGDFSDKNNLLSTPEVLKVKEALKVNCENLRAVVEDPLPAAVALAAEVLASLAKERGPVCNGNDACKDISGDNGGRSLQKLMRRNPTAHTSELHDDSIESPQDSPISSERIQLHSLRKRKISPLKVAEVPKFTMRRKKHKWTSAEEETLRESVKKYGKGHWKFILNCHPDIFRERTEVDLKDKWRNMTRYPQ